MPEMPPPPVLDRQLLERYVQAKDQQAFAQLVRRHLDLVHGAARRQAPQAADDITQAVFVLLAQRAARLPRHRPLTGWLCQATRFYSANLKKDEARRRQHEREAAAMAQPPTQDQTLENLLPLLDESLARLSGGERDAVVLRYLEGKSFEETGAELSITADAAGKRAGRGLEKLRAFFAKRGYIVPAAAVAGLLTAESAKAAPAALAAKVVVLGVHGAMVSTQTAAMAKGASAMMTWIKVKLAAAVIGAVVITSGAGVLVIQQALAAPAQPPTIASAPPAAAQPITPAPPPPTPPAPLLVALPATVPATQPVVLTELLAGISARAQRLQRMQADVSFEDDVAKESPRLEWVHTSSEQYQILRDGPKRRMIYEIRDRGKETTPTKSWYVWNGITGMAYLDHGEDRVPAEQPRFTGVTYAARAQHDVQDRLWVPLEQSVFDEHEPLAELAKKLRWTLVGKEQISGRTAWKLRGTPGDKSNTAYEIWIDPTRDFAPVRMVSYDAKAGRDIVSQEMSDVRLEQVDGIWVVAQATILVHNGLLEKDGYNTRERIVLHMTNQRVGLEIPPEAFTLQYPKGCSVWDDVAQIGYVVGEYVAVRDPYGAHSKVPWDQGVGLFDVTSQTGSTGIRLDQNSPWGEVTNGLQCRLLPVAQTTQPSDGQSSRPTVYVYYELCNTSGKWLYFKIPGTPLDMSGNHFHVTGPDGKEVQYVGIEAERDPLTREDFVYLQDNGTLTRRIGLPYDFSKPGTYRISVSTTLAAHDAANVFEGNELNLVWAGTLNSNAVTAFIGATSTTNPKNPAEP